MENKAVFLYPGQGSQEVGMGLDLYRSYPRARDIFDRADRFLGFSLSRLCFEGPDEALNSDLNAQLAVYTVSCIVTDLLSNNNVVPDVVSGYSSGFYAAAYAAGCFDFDRGLGLVRRAGELLLDEGRKIDGSMAVVFGLSPKKIANVCTQVEKAHVAIFNTPRQTVISGEKKAVQTAIDMCLKEGALDAYPLLTATAYHSRFMKRSGLRFLKEIEGYHFMEPRVPLVSYLLLTRVSDRNDLVRTMASQLSGPVRWVDLIKTLSRNGTRLFLEVGPGGVISRTVRWIDRSIEIRTTTPKSSLLEAIERYRELLSAKEVIIDNPGIDEDACRKRSSV